MDLLKLTGFLKNILLGLPENVLGEVAGDLVEKLFEGLKNKRKENQFAKRIADALTRFAGKPEGEKLLAAISENVPKRKRPLFGGNRTAKDLAHEAIRGIDGFQAEEWSKTLLAGIDLSDYGEEVKRDFLILLGEIQKAAVEYWKSMLEAGDLAIVNLISHTVETENEKLANRLTEELKSYLFTANAAPMSATEAFGARVLLCENCGETLLASNLKRTESGLFACTCPACNASFAFGCFTQEGKNWAQECDAKLTLALQGIEECNGKLDEILEELRSSERAARARAERNLRRAVEKEHPNQDEVISCANVVLQYDAEAFLAQFYLAAYSENYRDTAKFLDEIDEEKHFSDLEEIVRFMTKRPDERTILPVRRLIERTQERFKGASRRLREEVLTAFEEEMKKFDDGIYDVSRSRQVFVAYKTEDYAEVRKLVECLEEGGDIRCFVALRNLQNGLNAEDYRKSLETAIDHCSVFVLVSSHLSRTQGGAREEMEYVRRKDFANAPPQFRARNAYTEIPEEYKKPRVEYLIEDYRRGERGGLAYEFFSGQTYRTSPEEVRAQVQELVKAPIDIYRWCVKCSARVDAGVTRCYNCGGTAFAASLEKAIERRAEERVRAEYEKKAQEAMARQRAVEAERKAWEEAIERRIRGEYEKRAQEEAERKAREEAEKKAAPLSSFEIENGVLKKFLGNETEIIIPNSVTSIGDDAFLDCTGLTSITIPNSVTSIKGGAFQGCTGLTNITIPNSVTSIGDGAFLDCTGLTSITISNRVTSIGVEAFRGCTGLTNITIPNSVTSIKGGAFRNCIGLTSITIPKGVTSIKGAVFLRCTGLTSILVEAGNLFYHSDANCLIETASKTLIAGCNTSTIPDDGSVTSIDIWAFRGCTGLKSIIIPKSVTSIDDGAFSGCTELTSILVEEGNPDYHSDGNCVIETASKTLVLGCRTSKIPADGSVTSIGDNAFDGCTELTSITIPNRVASIGDFAFCDCTVLTSITIPNSVTSIGDNAFRDCTGLTSITIPKSMTFIREYAFWGCTNLKTVYFDGTRGEWDRIKKGKNAFNSQTKIYFLE